MRRRSLYVGRMMDIAFQVVSIISLLVAFATLIALAGDLFSNGFERLNFQFLTSFPSRFPERAGILSGWVGSALVMLVTAFSAIPLGIAAGVYLEEYARKNWFTALVEINIANLAGVPSIVFGLMALGLFVHKFDLGQSILTAGLTLGLLILPIIIVTTREAIRTVPVSIREAAYALGCTKWRMVRDHVVPYSLGGIATGIIIAMSRAIGETAPLVTIGALSFVAFLPDSPLKVEWPFVSFEWLQSGFTVLPMQMFNWVSRPQHEFHINAAAAGIVLVFFTILMNGVAIVIRQRFRRKIKW